MDLRVVNPWTGQAVQLDPAEISQERLDAWAVLIDDDLRERLADQGHETPAEYLAAYIAAVGPEEAGRVIIGS